MNAQQLAAANYPFESLTERRGAVFSDLENLFGGRRNAFKEEKPGEAYGANQLTQDLQFFAEWMSTQFEGFIVGTKRAYADFVAGFSIMDPTTNNDTGKKVSPHKELMEMGFETVSVFPLAKRKNSVDMRIAADMIFSSRAQTPAKRILLVAGDSDYVPIIVELRRAGVEVLVVGFKGIKGAEHTGKYLPKFADKFWYFEDLRKDEIEVNLTNRLEPHTTNYYKMILQAEEPRYFIVPLYDWVEITDAIFGELRSTVATPDEIVTFVRELGAGSSDKSVSVPIVVKQLLDSGCFKEADAKLASAGVGEWERPVGLAPEINSAQKMRTRVQKKLVNTLRERLQGLGDTRDLNEQALAELFFGPKPSAEEIKLAKQLVSAGAKIPH
jgi:uncharacterized LabA/DUF88 family protein